MNKCPHCGYVNPDKVSICINCGKSLYSSSEAEKKGFYGLFEEENLLRERYDKKNQHHKKEKLYINYLWDLFLIIFLWGLVLLVPCVMGFGKYYVLIYLTVAFSIIVLWIEIIYLLLFGNTVGEFIFSKNIPWKNKWLITTLLSLFPVLFSLLLLGIFRTFS